MESISRNLYFAEKLRFSTGAKVLKPLTFRFLFDDLVVLALGVLEDEDAVLDGRVKAFRKGERHQFAGRSGVDVMITIFCDF
jgi:hypothetical protein